MRVAENCREVSVYFIGKTPNNLRVRLRKINRHMEKHGNLGKLHRKERLRQQPNPDIEEISSTQTKPNNLLEQYKIDSLLI